VVFVGQLAKRRTKSTQRKNGLVSFSSKDTSIQKVHVSLQQMSGWNLLIPIFLGFVAYGFVTRFHGLNPWNTEWLLPFRNGGIDSAANYLGWEFFRQAPLLQWPLGLSPNLGQGVGGSISMTDSLPLFAFIFKPLLLWSNEPFQYFGIWTLTCFVLQSVFGWKVLAHWVNSRAGASIATCFLLITPAFIDRFTYHFALAGHWLILAAINLYFSPNAAFWKWLTLSCVSVLVQPYLSLLVMAIYVASSVSRLLRRQTTKLIELKYLLVILGCFLFCAYQAGAFVFGVSNTSVAGFGTYSANVLSFVDPGYSSYSPELWSRLIPNQWQSDGQYEGFAFLGSGILLLSVALIPSNFGRVKVQFELAFGLIVIVSSLALLTNSEVVQRQLIGIFGLLALSIGMMCFRKLRNQRSRFLPLLMVIAVVTMFSFSNRVFVGDHELVDFELPKSVLELFSVFRASGRSIWTAMYLVTLATLIVVLTRFRRVIAVPVLILALIFQVAESRSAIAVARSAYHVTGPKLPFESETWKAIGSRYKHIFIVHPVDTPRLFAFPLDPDVNGNEGFIWRDMGVFATANHMTLNAFYFAREPVQAAQFAVEQSKSLVASENYQIDTLYVFVSPDAWEYAKIHHRPTDLVAVVDGFPILAPMCDALTCKVSVN